jgi:hypothetical protein
VPIAKAIHATAVPISAICPPSIGYIPTTSFKGRLEISERNDLHAACIYRPSDLLRPNFAPRDKRMAMRGLMSRGPLYSRSMLALRLEAILDSAIAGVLASRRRRNLADRFQAFEDLSVKNAP